MPEPLLDYKGVLPSDFEHCRKIIKVGSKSFHAASLLLPKEIRNAAFATYAFCRSGDDAVDLGSDPQAELDTLKRRLDRIYAGNPFDDPIDRAFAFVVAAWEMPRALPDALLEGFAWDAEGRRYKTLDELLSYAARVAAAVGGLMTTLMDATDKTAAARACDLGTAMQLSNIARDIGEDARAGRIYVPTDWLADAGIDEDEFLKNPVFDDRIAGVTKRLIEAADPLYERGLSGVSCLPSNCRTAITSAGLIYQAIGREIAANNYDSINHRAYVTKQKKLALVAKAFNWKAPATSDAPPIPENSFLVDAISARSIKHSLLPVPSRTAWILDLFKRMDERASEADTRHSKAT
ncbi:MAG: phytoene/squalene synthase family protein [Pseudomonadota bacterium]